MEKDRGHRHKNPEQQSELATVLASGHVIANPKKRQELSAWNQQSKLKVNRKYKLLELALSH
jgi:hypothetical protein